MKPTLARLGALNWKTLPRKASAVSSTLAAALSDGSYLLVLHPRLVLIAPAAGLMGVAFGWLHLTFSDQRTYTASLIAIASMLTLGVASTNLGVWAWAGYVVGDFFLRGPAYIYGYGDINISLARIIHIFEDNKSLICYKHVVETVFEAANEASECLTIAQHSVCCSQEFFASPWWPSSTSERGVPTVEPCC